MGFLFNSGTKAAKISAKATMDSANMQANNDRLVAQAAVSSQQTMIAQKQAADKAAEILGTPQEKVDVQLATDTDAPTLDAATGKRKTTRTPFLGAPASNTGVHI